MTEQNEPSMEAILASIRNILADDEDETPEPAAEKEQQPAPVAEENTQQEPEIPEEEEIQPAAPEPVEEAAPVVPESESAPLPEETKTDEPADGILNLTPDMIVDEPKPEPVEKPAEPLIEPEEEDDFTPEPVIPQEPMKEETLTDLIKETAAKQLEGDMLLAEPTVMAATESLSHLRNIAVERQLELGNGTLTIETIVRETLKPYLKEWLDEHLPDIVERVVRKEVAHIMDRLDLK